mgnify:FL=1
MVQERYLRHVLHWGEKNQQQLANCSVLVAGLGGLGAIVSQLLARAGVGTLYLVDDGKIDPPDLNRQLLYSEADLGQPKLAVAAARLRQINSTITLTPLPGRITPGFTIPDDVHVVADCLDNYASRFALETCLSPGTFLVHGGIEGDQGQVLTLQKSRSRPFAEIFSGCLQPPGPIAVTGAGATVLAGLMANELYSVIFGEPKLLDRCLVVGLEDLHLSFLEV